MRKRAIPLAVAALLLASASPAAAVSRGRVAVFPRVRLDAPVVTLADLLPATAPFDLRLRARKISFGAAPLPGALRRLTRAEIVGRSGARLAAELAIPSSVVVERASRRISRREVLRAIRAALRGKGFANADRLTTRDVRIGVPIRVTVADAGLRVLGMTLDPELRTGVFRLWTANDHRVRPFDVMVRPVDGLGRWLEQASGRQAFPNPASGPDSSSAQRTQWARPERGKPLVLPWQPASLLLVTGTMEIHTVVEPLERGYLGEVIRVRMKSTRQVFRARVVAPDFLEARF